MRVRNEMMIFIPLVELSTDVVDKFSFVICCVDVETIEEVDVVVVGTEQSISSGLYVPHSVINSNMMLAELKILCLFYHENKIKNNNYLICKTCKNVNLSFSPPVC